MDGFSVNRQYFDAFRKVLKEVTSTLSPNEVLDHLVKNVTDVLSLKGCAIRLLAPSKRTLELVASCGLSDKFIEKGPVNADSSIAATLEGCVVTVLDAAKDQRIQYPEAAHEEGIASLASLPLTHKGRVIGVMRLYTGERRVFTEEDLRFAEALAEMGGIAIQNARTHEGLREDFDRTVALYTAEINA